jgi:hypothetical protein
VSIEEVVGRFDIAHRLFRHGEPRHLNLRPFLKPIWAILSLAASSDIHGSSGEYRQIVESLRRLSNQRRKGDVIEPAYIVQPLIQIAPEAEVFSVLHNLPAEHRLKLFDEFIRALDREGPREHSARRLALAFLAGYIATVVAGGGPSLSLAEESATRRPDLTAWAYVLGSVGESVIWTSSFDGLGRLVARELMRPLRLDESPTCDVAFDEAKALVDPQLSDPLVHLRLKQARSATIALLPGVNVAVPLSEGTTTSPPTRPQEGVRRGPQDWSPGTRSAEVAMGALADLLLPYIEARLMRRLRSGMQEPASSYRGGDKRSRSRPKGATQSGLPLDDPQEE